MLRVIIAHIFGTIHIVMAFIKFQLELFKHTFHCSTSRFSCLTLYLVIQMVLNCELCIRRKRNAHFHTQLFNLLLFVHK